MNDVRAATLDDAPDIAAVQVAGWQAAYAGLMPAAVLAAQTVENRAPRWHSILSVTVPEKRHAVFERAGRIVGFASSGPSRDADAAGAGELWALYAHPAAWGTGVGRGLMLDAIAFLAAHAHPRVTLWVLRGNARAIAFYEGFGFRLDGATKIEGALEELRMVRELSR